MVGIPTMFTKFEGTLYVRSFINEYNCQFDNYTHYMKLLSYNMSPNFVNIVGIPTMYATN